MQSKVYFGIIFYVLLKADVIFKLLCKNNLNINIETEKLPLHDKI